MREVGRAEVAQGRRTVLCRANPPAPGGQGAACAVHPGEWQLDVGQSARSKCLGHRRDQPLVAPGREMLIRHGLSDD